MARFPLAALALAALLTAAAPAQAPWPVYFTDNLAAQNTTETPTPLEQALLDALDDAATSIDFALYDFNRVAVRDALIAAQGRGVAVRVVGDDDAYTEPGFAPHFAALEAAGIPVVLDGPTAAGSAPAAPHGMPEGIAEMAQSNLMHNKYAIIDSARVWTGSVNMSNTDLTLNHNNALLVDSPALAALYQSDFDQMIGGVFGTDKQPTLALVPTHTVTLSGVVASVYFAPQDNPIQPIVAEIEAATDTIDFAIFYFTNDLVRDALLAARARGVQVRGLWDALGVADASSDYPALCAAGIPIKIENTRGKMHHKLMILDAAQPQARVITGSLNWTAAATTVNNENTLILRSPALAAAYSAEFARMWDFFAGVALCKGPFLPLIWGGGEPEAPPPQTPSLRFTRIVYNPDGPDLDAERVELTLFGPASAPPLALAGYTLRDEAGQTYTFGPVQITTAAPLSLWTKSGADTATDLYWGKGQPVWNNDGDAATLRDAAGAVVDVCAYAGGEVETLCE